MSANDEQRNRPEPEKPRTDEVFGDLFKGIGTVLDALVQAIDVGGSPGPTAPRNRAPAARPQSPVLREPLVDLFDEPHEIVIVAELPGVHPDDIRLELDGDVLALETSGEYHYARELLLPCVVRADGVRRRHSNGILEVRLAKQ